jgi:YbbR domain-containing protein
MSSLAIDEFKNIYMTGVVNVNSVVKYSPSGKIDVLAGVSRSRAYVDGNNAEVRFTRDLTGIVIDSMGNILVSDLESNAIRKVVPIAP